MDHYEVVVIGAGIYGSAVAYFLTQQSLRVALLEQGKAGRLGASAFSKGIVRVYDPDPLLAELSLWGMRELNGWESCGYPGVSPYARTGCLYRISPSNEALAARIMACLHDKGYEGAMLRGGELQKKFPALMIGADDQAIWEEDSGYGQPLTAVKNFLDGFIANGGVLTEDCAMTMHDSAVRRTDGWRMTVNGRQISADLILVAAGAYTPALLPGSGIFTRSISLLLLSHKGGNRVPYPIVDEVLQTYTRPEGEWGIYCGTPLSEEAPSPEMLSPYGVSEKEDADRRVRQLVRGEYLGAPVSGFKAFDGYTASRRPIIGPMPGRPGIFVAAGFSGRGFKFHLPVAKALAWKICDHLGRTPRMDHFDLSVIGLVDQLAVK